MLKSDIHKPGTLKGMVKSEVYKPDTFLYFAYGGNILTFRIHMHSPSAEFVTIARLDNFRLDFTYYTKFWGGPAPTVVPTANAHVWGVIWRIDSAGLATLEIYKGMSTKRSFVNHVIVNTCHMGQFKCRVYMARTNPLPHGDNDLIPVGRWPSISLKHVLLLGAKEHDFPPYYIQLLKRIRDNGQRGLFEQECLLRRYCSKPNCVCPIMREKISRARLTRELPCFRRTLDKLYPRKEVQTVKKSLPVMKEEKASEVTEAEKEDEKPPLLLEGKKIKKGKLNFS